MGLCVKTLFFRGGLGLVELPSELKDESQQFSQGCSSGSNNSFIATGRGGIPKNPNQYLNSNQTWSDLRDFSTSRNVKNKIAEITTISNKPAIVEATGFIRNQDGDIELVASGNQSLKTQTPNCSGKYT